MSERAGAVVLAVVLVVTIVTVDVVCFRHQLWARLLANVGLVALAGAVHLRHVRQG